MTKRLFHCTTKSLYVILCCTSAATFIQFLTSETHRSLLTNEEWNEKYNTTNKVIEEVLIDVGEEITEKTTPLFWHIPKAGGTTVSDVVSHCLGMTTANERGGIAGKSKKLDLMQVHDGSLFVTADTTTPEGLVRAKKMGFAEAELADIIMTGFLPLATQTLFDEAHPASVFSIFRHPSERTISLFYYLRDAHWEPTYHPEWKEMTLTEYLESDKAEKDWMVRNLVGNRHGKLSDEDLTQAKKIVSKKMWVGLISKMEESMNRFGAVYEWTSRPEWEVCLKSFAEHGSNKHHHPEVDRNSTEWELLQKSNYYDLQLYAHAVRVFQEQREHFTSIDTIDVEEE